MNNLKKIIFMSLIPTVLTIFFVVQFTIPAVKKYLNIKEELKQEKLTFENTKINIKKLKANKQLLNELNKLNTELIGFNVEFPSRFKDEILLIDLEIFANESVNRIVELKSLREKEVEIITPEKEAEKNAEKNKRRRRVKKEEIKLPVQIIEKSFEINTVAYYNEIINFVKFLESYQRKINISSISAKVFNDDKENINPRIELKIQGSVYKSIINDISDDKKELKITG